MFYLISYDIDYDKTRDKVAKTLEAHGTRVQLSVFECFLRSSEYNSLKEKLRALLDEARDSGSITDASIRLYGLCKTCTNRIEFLGDGKLTVDPGYFIV